MQQLLEGLRVLELSNNVAGPFTGKLLAEYGADVVKIEPLEGDSARHQGPYKDDIPNVETSLLFLHLNTNKKSITLNFESENAVDITKKFIDKTDIVIESFAPGQMENWGLSYEALAKDHEDLIMASITPFGQSGPWKDYKASEIVLQALGGPLHANGSAFREPIKSGGNIAQYHAGIATAFACIAARLRIIRGGRGDHIDQSIYEAQAGFRDRRTSFTTGTSYTGYVAKRQPPGARPASGPRMTTDGYANIFASGSRRFPAALDLIGRPDLKDHPDAKKQPHLFSQEFASELEGSWMAWLINRDKKTAIAETQEIGLLGGAIYTTKDLIEDEHYRSREVWDTIDHPVAGSAVYTGRQILLSETSRKKPLRAPLLGEHNNEIYAEIGFTKKDIDEMKKNGII
tara:strand:- start:14595 stop:15800 length:1206 start_codon:yes stop_codon:yes gene_type:complete